MYTNFYNLKEKPFNLTPSPRYLYLGEVHKEALAFLTYGVVERKGFMVLTGEVGTGKTTMVQALLSNLDENVETVYVSNPMLSDRDFIDYVASSAFKKKVRFKSKADFLLEFEEFLKDCLKNQRIFLLIIDEAQRLSFTLLEQIRLLSNMETADEKLINVFLIGQPELNEKLSEPRCRALLQRISVRHHMKPLDLEGTREYLMTRLKIAGASNGARIFPKNTVKAIYQYSGGYPRMINILADNALLLGYAREKKRITPAMIEECYTELRPGKTTESKPSMQQVAMGQVRGKRRSSGLPVWKWMIASIGVGAIALFLIQYRGEIPKNFSSHVLPYTRKISDKLFPKKKSPTISRVDLARPQKKTLGTDQSTENPAKTVSGEPNEDQSELGRQEPAETEKLAVGQEEPRSLYHKKETADQWPVRVVKWGDTLAKLAMEVYGYTDQRVLELIKQYNPGINDVNFINVGQKIVFPPVTEDVPPLTYTVHVGSFGPFGEAREEFLRLSAKGYDVYILPSNNPDGSKSYKVTIGNFDSLEAASEYASVVMEKGIFAYAKPILLEVR